MPYARSDSLVLTPLTPASDFSAFALNLEAHDIRARFGRPVDPVTLHRMLVSSAPDNRAIGAWMGPSLVGVGTLAKCAIGRWEFAVIVRSDLKRRRIGTALGHRALAEARMLGAVEVVAHVRSDNRATLGLAQALGFVMHDGPGREQVLVARLPPRRQAAVERRFADH